MPYLRGEQPHMEGCVFCRKLDAEDVDEHVLCRGDHSFVVLNRYPYSNGHLMVVPYAHVASLRDLDERVVREMMWLVREAERILIEEFGPEGFNVGINEGRAAGAGIEEHLHIHVVPRWEGDANYMTVIAETRVIPELLSATYDRLAPAFADLGRTRG
jgi:ATP adenylyltransferase